MKERFEMGKEEREILGFAFALGLVSTMIGITIYYSTYGFNSPYGLKPLPIKMPYERVVMLEVSLKYPHPFGLT